MIEEKCDKTTMECIEDEIYRLHGELLDKISGHVAKEIEENVKVDKNDTQPMYLAKHLLYAHEEELVKDIHITYEVFVYYWYHKLISMSRDQKLEKVTFILDLYERSKFFRRLTRHMQPESKRGLFKPKIPDHIIRTEIWSTLHRRTRTMKVKEINIHDVLQYVKEHPNKIHGHFPLVLAYLLGKIDYYGLKL